MAKITITEALAELKTIGKRLEKKQQFVLQFLMRPEQVRDPLEKDKGSATAVAVERQSMRDLQERMIGLRRVISDANARETIKIGDKTRSLTDWLVWRREVAPHQQRALADIRNSIDSVRRQSLQKGSALVQSVDQAKAGDIVVNLSESELAVEIEMLENTLGVLDGQLSLKNATVLLDV